MTLDEAYMADPVLAAARLVRRAGRWDAALAILGELDTPLARALRAETSTERYLWQLGDPAPALEAIAALDGTPLATLLTTELEYWRQLFKLDGEPYCGDPVSAFGSLRGAAELGGWPDFWHAVSIENLHGETEVAAKGYQAALESSVASGDILLESHAVRHIGAQALDAGDREEGLALLRLSYHQRAAIGTRPHTAAAAATLAGELGDTREAADLRGLVTRTAEDLGLTWLR
ncbi:hypothetical protein [Longispora albida]|uniref:hypothetical protein n=1 Tax=Longispora albida TaxID=203523 RepID=UPI00035FF903|nr:hypothetical protein [Longispora albida]